MKNLKYMYLYCNHELYSITYSSYIDTFIYSLAPTFMIITCRPFKHVLHSSKYLNTQAVGSFGKNEPKTQKKHNEKGCWILVGVYNQAFPSLHMSYFSLCIYWFSYFPYQNEMSRFLCNGETCHKLVKNLVQSNGALTLLY